LLFGQDIDGEPEEGDAQLKVGKMMPYLMDLQAFVGRVYQVIKNMIQQMASLYHNHQQLYNKSFKGVCGNQASAVCSHSHTRHCHCCLAIHVQVHLNTVFHMMSELLTVLITLDEIIGQNPNFKLAWSMYKRMSKTIRSDASRYGTDEERMLQFEKLLLQIEGFLLDGRIYHVCVHTIGVWVGGWVYMYFLQTH
jgi:WASH complex subunit 7